MFATDQYELLDFGEGRRLERFGPYVLNRLCPSVEGTRKSRPELWNEIDAIFVSEKNEPVTSHAAGGRGVWKPVLTPLPEPWNITTESFTLELKLTPFGHVGLFPEQAANWLKMMRLLALRPGARVLHLFGYTGAGTLAAAAAGAEVTHVDAAHNVVEWAKRNAMLSGLEAAPIRWIVEDAAKFVRRSLRRGCRYDAILLDPPSYGHGSKGEVWRLSKHLPALLRDCFALLSDEPLFLMLTAHTPGYDAPRLANMLRGASQGSVSEYRLEEPTGNIRGFRMALPAASGKRLAAGAGATFLDASVIGCNPAS